MTTPTPQTPGTPKSPTAAVRFSFACPSVLPTQVRVVAAALLCGATLGATAWAQAVPNASVMPVGDQDKKTNETLVLSPFTVNTSKDVGFVATSALAGGRLATELKD